MLARLFGLALLTGVLGIGSAAAGLVSGPDVPAMVRSADLIVVGRAEAVRVQGPAASASETFYVAVDRALKGGAANPSRRILVRLDISNSDHDVVAERQYGIFFLRRERGVYVAADPYHPALVAAPSGRAVTQGGSATALTAVARELSQVLVTPGASLINPTTGVQRLSSAAPAEQVQGVYRRAAIALKSIPYENAGPSLQALAAAAGSARLWAAYCLLFMGDSPALEALKAQALQSVAPDLLGSDAGTTTAVSWLAESLDGRITSRDAVPTLIALLGSPKAAVRRGAAHVLSQVGTRAEAASLTNVALNDPDPDVRYFALRGLARVTKAASMPTTDEFARDEARLLRALVK